MSDDFGDIDVPFAEHIRPHLPEKLRSFICDFPGSPDHGHTSCVFFALAANEIDRLRTWDGMMSVLDEHYPPDVFTGVSGDPGPRLIVLTREVDRLRAQVARLAGEVETLQERRG